MKYIFALLLLCVFSQTALASAKYDVQYNNITLKAVDVMYDVDRGLFLIEFKSSEGYTKGYFSPKNITVRINGMSAYDSLTKEYTGTKVTIHDQEELISVMLNDCMHFLNSDEERVQFETNVKNMYNRIYAHVKEVVFTDMVYSTWDYQPEEYNARCLQIASYVMSL